MFGNYVMLQRCLIFLVVIVGVKGTPERDHALIYLTKFGYFDGELNAEQLSDGTAFANAVSEFQEGAGLQVSGQLTDATLRMMSRPRCGFKDKMGTGSDNRSRRYALQGSSWRRSNLKYKISTYPRRIPKTDVDREVSRAFSVWSKHADLTFNPSPDVADIEIKFEKYEHGDENPFDGKGGVLAHANFPTHGGGVHFDASEDWAVNSTDAEKKDLYKIAAHEIGHALGLAHSDVILSLMAPFYNPLKSGPLTAEDDVRAIQALYGTRHQASPINLHRSPQDSMLCAEPQIDAIFTKKDDTYIIKGDSYWKLSQNGSILNGYPKKTSSRWTGLPESVNAAFTGTTGRSYFFRGAQVWRYTGETGSLDDGYPKEITEVFPGIPDHINAAFIWGGNGKLYFFKGSRFWVCGGQTKSCLKGNYPKPISHWKGLPDRVNAAFSAKDGYTYFFKGGFYYKFDDVEFAVVEDNPPYPRSTRVWLGCSLSH